jgi:hypothetical protein
MPLSQLFTLLPPAGRLWPYARCGCGAGACDGRVSSPGEDGQVVASAQRSQVGVIIGAARVWVPPQRVQPSRPQPVDVADVDVAVAPAADEADVAVIVGVRPGERDSAQFCLVRIPHADKAITVGAARERPRAHTMVTGLAREFATAGIQPTPWRLLRAHSGTDEAVRIRASTPTSPARRRGGNGHRADGTPGGSCGGRRGRRMPCRRGQSIHQRADDGLIVIYFAC